MRAVPGPEDTNRTGAFPAYGNARPASIGSSSLAESLTIDAVSAALDEYES